MKKLNVFTYGYLSMRPCNWFHNFKQFFRNLKYAYQRATSGFCDYDTWNLDIYYLDLIIESLEKYKNNLHGCPTEFYEEDTENPSEAWENYLEDIIDNLKKSDENYYNNPYDSWENFENWKKEEIRIRNSREVHFNKGMHMLMDVFDELWD